MPKSKPAALIDGPSIVYPVEGRFLAGVPAVPAITDGATAARLVATGAFEWAAPDATQEITVQPLPESALAVLGFYAPED